MKWEEMTPRQRDALVAEKVMGEGDQSMVQQMPDGTFQPIAGIWPLCPEYTTDIAAALLVGEQVKTFTLTSPGTFIPPGDVNGPQWLCAVWYQTEVGGYAYKEALADSASEALCLAALRAKGVEV